MTEYRGTGRTRHGDSVACYSKGCEYARGWVTPCQRHLLAEQRRPQLGDLTIERIPGESCPHFVAAIIGGISKTETEGKR